MFVIFLFLQIALSVVVPVEYVLELDVSMERLQYTGNVTIKVRAMSETQNITMDSRSTVTEVRCTMHLEKWKKYSDSVSIYLKKPMIAGQEEEIFLSFSGLISMNSTSGFYASLSKDILAITQFETHGASTVFPCFDDPDLKAHFKLQVAVEEPFVVLGNMEVEKFKILDKVVYRFQKTPKISTYLVAWAIGKSLFLSSDTIPNIRVFCIEDCREYEYGLMVTQESVLYFENLLDFKYPNQKLDVFPVPVYPSNNSDLMLVEGMENFGLITIEDRRFKINHESSFGEKFYIATLIAHEVAHQWFGDVVTLAKWSELWLNEGFAEYFQYHSVQRIFPETEGLFYIKEFIPVFEADSSRFSHSVAGSDKFDDITYNKGAVVLSMISHFMDRARFTRVDSNFSHKLRLYLKKYAFSNTVTKDLLNILGSDVSRYIQSWLFEPGFPIIFVENRMVDNMRLITLKQKRYSLSKDLLSSTWNISVDLKLLERNSEGSVRYVKSMNIILDQHSLELTIPAQYQFFLNLKTTGLYYTHYGNVYQEVLSDICRNKDVFDGLERAHFIYQAFQLSLSLKLAWTDAIQSLNILKNETSPVVWETVLNLWFKFDGILHQHRTLKFFKDTVRIHLPPLGSSWPESPIMFLGVLANIPEYVEAAQKVFSSWTSSRPIFVIPDYFEAIYYAAMKNDTNFELLWDRRSEYPGDYLKGLILSQNPKNQKRIFYYILENLSISDLKLYSEYFLYYSPTTFKIIWSFLKNDYPNIIAKAGSFTEGVVAKFAQDPEQLNEIKALISDKTGSWDTPSPNEPYFYSFVRKGIEKAQQGIEFRNRNSFG